MSLTVNNGKTLLMEPWECAKYDPPLAEFLKLKVAPRIDSGCPHCGHAHFGTANPIGYLHVKVCHNSGCGKKYRHPPSLYDLRDLTDALLGTPKRLGQG